MTVKVRLIERNFLDNGPDLCYKHYPCAKKFDVLMDANQELTHLALLDKENNMVAFFPSGGWIGVELVKEK